MAWLSPRDMGAQRYALLHDADEAFGLPDLLTMVKARFPSFRQAQAGIGAAIEHRFSLDPEDHARIKPADRQALMLERLAVKPRGDHRFWRLWSGGLPRPEGIKMLPLAPAAAHRLYAAALLRVFRDRRPIDTPWLQGQPGFAVRPERIANVLWNRRATVVRAPAPAAAEVAPALAPA